MIKKKCYQVETVNIYILSLINTLQEKIGYLPPKRVKLNCQYFVIIENGKLPSMGETA